MRMPTVEHNPMNAHHPRRIPDQCVAATGLSLKLFISLPNATTERHSRTICHNRSDSISDRLSNSICMNVSRLQIPVYDTSVSNEGRPVLISRRSSIVAHIEADAATTVRTNPTQSQINGRAPICHTLNSTRRTYDNTGSGYGAMNGLFPKCNFVSQRPRYITKTWCCQTACGDYNTDSTLSRKVRQRMKIAMLFFFAVCVGWCGSWLVSDIKASDENIAPKVVANSATTNVPDEIAETDRLSKLVEDAVDDYQLFPSQTSSTELLARPVLRWRNTARGQDGEAMFVIWHQVGHPLAMASIYPWAGNLMHEFDLLARKPGLVAKSKEDVIWMPTSAGVDFRKVPDAKVPAASPAARLREMKVIAERFEGTMTGWNSADSDNEKLRLLPRPLYRYQVSPEEGARDVPLDGALLAFATGTDPEIVLVIEAFGTGDALTWEYACVRATSGGLEMRLDGTVVWTAAKFPQQSAQKPHFTQTVPVPESDPDR